MMEYSKIFYFVGLTSLNSIHKWAKIEKFVQKIDFFGLKDISYSRLPRNLLFSFKILIHFRKIKKIDKDCNIIFTRTYSILWLFTYIIKGYKVIYYAPGLGNPISIGRFQYLSFLKNIYNKISFNTFRKASSLLAAASKHEILKVNNNLSKLKSRIYFKQVVEGVNTELFKPLNKEILLQNELINLKIKNNDIVFLFVGRLAKVKGIDLIIDAFEEFHKNIFNSFLLIAGDGELKSKIKEYIKEKNLENSIKLLGNLKPESLVKFINICNAGVFASYTEGFSIAMLEILACGKPIISTLVSGTDELILPNKTGIIINSRNAKDYAQAMQEILDVRYSTSICRNLVLNNYTLSTQWKNILNEFGNE